MVTTSNIQIEATKLREGEMSKEAARECAEEIANTILINTAMTMLIENIIERHMAKCAARLVEENAELKEHCNVVWQLIKPFIPACPATARKFLDQAIEDSKILSGEGTHQLKELREENARLVDTLKHIISEAEQDLIDGVYTQYNQETIDKWKQALTHKEER